MAVAWPRAVSVRSRPPRRVSDGPSVTTVPATGLVVTKVGADQTLECSAVGKPEPKIFWRKQVSASRVGRPFPWVVEAPKLPLHSDYKPCLMRAQSPFAFPTAGVLLLYYRNVLRHFKIVYKPATRL